MVANKTATEKGANWGKFGGKTPMHSFSGTGEQEPGQSAQEGSGSRRGIEPKAGGEVGFYSSSTQNKFGAGTQEPGCSSQAGNRQEGFAHGGKTHMFSNRGSLPAKGGSSSQ